MQSRHHRVGALIYREFGREGGLREDGFVEAEVGDTAACPGDEAGCIS